LPDPAELAPLLAVPAVEVPALLAPPLAEPAVPVPPLFGVVTGAWSCDEPTVDGGVPTPEGLPASLGLPVVGGVPALDGLPVLAGLPPAGLLVSVVSSLPLGWLATTSLQ